MLQVQLGKIGDESAIIPLADVPENSDLGGRAKDALKEFGEVCIPEVIKRVEHRIAHPIRGEGSIDRITAEALNTIGKIRCERSIKFMNRLLDLRLFNFSWIIGSWQKKMGLW